MLTCVSELAMRASSTNMATKSPAPSKHGQDALDRDLLLEAGRALIDGAEDLGHAALRQALDEKVLAEGDRLHEGHDYTTVKFVLKLTVGRPTFL